jgi:hypothetical protein
MTEIPQTDFGATAYRATDFRDKEFRTADLRGSDARANDAGSNYFRRTRPPADDFRARAMATIGAQPIAIAGAALLFIVAGMGAIFMWRMATGLTPEQERIASGRQVQARVAQTSEQIMEKTKGLEMSQQESIDHLQSVQDQLRAIQQAIAAQRTDTKRLTEQVGEISSSLDGLRQAYASTQPTESVERPSVRRKPVAHRAHGKAKKSRVAKHGKRKSRG